MRVTRLSRDKFIVTKQEKNTHQMAAKLIDLLCTANMILFHILHAYGLTLPDLLSIWFNHFPYYLTLHNIQSL